MDVTKLVQIGFLKLFRAARLEKFEWNSLSSALCFQADKVTEEKRQCEDPPLHLCSIIQGKHEIENYIKFRFWELFKGEMC